MKHWTGQAAGRVLLTGATGLSAAGCCGNSRSRTAGVLRNTGWYYGNGFWRLRGLLEKLVGAAPRAPGSRPAGGGRHARLLAGRGLRKGSAPAALKRDEDPGRIWLQFESTATKPERPCARQQSSIPRARGSHVLVRPYPVHYLIFEGIL
jgi:hypothetical protein